LITTHRRRSAVFATMLALVSGMIPGSISAGAPAPPGECATIMDTADIEELGEGRFRSMTRGDTLLGSQATKRTHPCHA
jgi:hypothetical protein